MTDEGNKIKAGGFWQSITFKIMIIGLIILMLLIPLIMIYSLIQERETYLEEAKQDIVSGWAGTQTISGPVIALPYRQVLINDKQVIESKKIAYFLPDELHITGEINPEIRYRGIYKTVVYSSDLQINGYFAIPKLDGLHIKASDVLWNEAYTMIGITDMRGIQNQVSFHWNDSDQTVNPGLPTDEIIQSGFNSGIEFTKQDQNMFSFQLNLNGSENLNFIPLGEKTTVNLKSGWGNPGFEGAFLPDQRTVNSKGFTASWEIFSLNRNFPQQWIGNNYNIEGSAFGVRLIMPVDHYTKITRSVKYAIMFIALTFMVFFFFEVTNKYRIHPVQYLLVGLALCIFYILLLSLSEHVGYNVAYLIAGIGIITMVTGYSHSVFKKTNKSVILGIILVVLYLFLFTLIQLQDYSLLMGSIGLFVAMAIIMYISRNIDWYRPVGKEGPGDKRLGF